MRVSNSSVGDQTAEVQVLKAVLLREGYIQRLHHLERHSHPSLAPGFTDLLDIVRIASVEVVETIIAWRKDQKIGGSSSRPFLWNGINYLLRMPSDLDFLVRNAALSKFLGFSVHRNPFVVPLSMENASFTNVDDRKGSGSFGIPQGGFTKIGRDRFTYADKKRAMGQTTPPSVLKLRSSPKKGERPRSRLLPYAVPIIDTEHMSMVPSIVRKPAPPRLAHSESCSFIGDLEMQRLRQAERIILAEEAMHGRFLRDKKGNLVPAFREERARFAFDLSTDDGRPMIQEARACEAPFAIPSGVGHRPLEASEVDQARSLTKSETDNTKENTDSNFGGLKREVTSCKGRPGPRSRARKIGGELYSPPYPGTFKGRGRAPVRAEQTALVDLGIGRKKRENDALDGELARLKEEKDRIESAIHPLVDSHADDIQQVRKGIERTQDLIEFNQNEITARERQLSHLRSFEKKTEDKRRAWDIERKRRMLSLGEFPSSKDEHDDEVETIEDIASSSIQRFIRGALTRAKFSTYRDLCERCAATIQGGVRGMYGRREARRVLRRHQGAISIQRIGLGHLARMRFGELLKRRFQMLAATVIQKHVRSLICQSYVKEKMAYNYCSAEAAHAISSVELLPSDLLDLANAIEAALLDVREDFPPPSALGLMRIVCLVLENVENKVVNQVSEFSRIGVRFSQLVGATMDWTVAMKVLHRSSGLLRKLRVLSMSPTSRRPRKISIPKSAVVMYRAYETDPGFSEQAFAKMRRGSRAACLLLKFIKNLMLVNDKQHSFLAKSVLMECARHYFIRAKKEHRILLANLCARTQRLTIIKAATEISPEVVRVLVLREEDEQSNIRTKLKQVKLEEKREITNAQSSLRRFEQEIADVEAQIFLSKEKLKPCKDDNYSGGDANLSRGLEVKVDEMEIQVIDFRMQLKTIKADVTMMSKFHELLLEGNHCVNLRSSCCELGEVQGKIDILRHVGKGQKVSSTLTGKDGAHHGDTMLAYKEELSALKTRKVCLKEDLQTHLTMLNAEMSGGNYDDMPYNFGVNGFDALNDIILAKEECSALKSFVPQQLLKEQTKTKPKVIIFGRDVPAHAKERMLQALYHDLPGCFIRVSVRKNLGIDLYAFQRVLDAGQIVVADADVGISQSTRDVFLNGFQVCKMALHPVPDYACVLGSLMNKNGKDPSLGTSESDLSVMKDGELKRMLESIIHLLDELKADSVKSLIKDLSQCSRPLNLSYVLVMEAVVILLSPTGKFRNPNNKLAAISWLGTRRLLVEADRLIQSLASVDILDIPDSNLAVLTAYMAHRSWPNHFGVNEGNLVIQLLCGWIGYVVRFSMLLKEKGGIPPRLEESSGLFPTVVEISDDTDGTRSLDLNWHNAYNKVLSFLLRDRAVRNDALEFETDRLSITTFLGYGKIFFMDESNKLTTNIEFGEVDSLIATDKIFSRRENRHPPQTQKELFSRLSKTLRVRRKGRRLVLECKKETTVLLKECRKISGILAYLTVSENHSEEIYCVAYIPKFAQVVEVVADEELLIKLLPNTSPVLEEESIKICNSLNILRPIIDRLALKYGEGSKVSLHIRTKGGPGRPLFSCTYQFSGLTYLLFVREIGRDGMLLVQAYSHLSCAKVETHVSAIERVLCFNGVDGNWNRWRIGLLQRLSIRRSADASKLSLS